MYDKMSVGDKVLIILIVLALLILIICFIPPKEETIGIESNKVNLILSSEDFTILSIRDKVIDVEYKFDKSPLWSLYLIDTNNIVNGTLNIKCKSNEKCLVKITSLDKELSKIFSIEKRKNEEILVLNWRTDKYNLIVTVNILLPRNSNLSYWSISVRLNNKKYILWLVDFPILKIKAIGSKEHTYLAMPLHSGTLIRNPIDNIHWRISPIEEVANDWDKNSKLVLGAYPGTYSMQFAAVYGDKGGIYLATYDGEMYSKRFIFDGDNKSSLLFTLRQFPENMLTSREYNSPYSFVLGVFQGDWMDAAELYRKWALKQSWAKKGPLYCWYDLSHKIRNLNFGIGIQYVSISRYNLIKSNILAMKQLFDSIASINNTTPSYAIHFVGWSKYLDVVSDTPDYFPPQPGFKDLVDELKRFGIISAIYMGTGVFNTRLPLDEKSTLNWKEAKPYAAYNPFNEYYIRFRKAWMCPYTSWWQELLSSYVPQAQKECHIDGIYWDHYPVMKLCFHRGHNHPLGGGNYYSVGFRQLAQRIREIGKRNDPDFFTYNEGKCEIEIGVFDGFLNEFYHVEDGSLFDFATFWYGRMGEPIPLVTYVYHDYAIMIGGFRASKGHESFSNPDQFAYVNAYIWTCGNKLGFIDRMNLFLKWKRGELTPRWEEVLKYIGTLIKMSKIGNEFLTLGRYVRPPALEGISSKALLYNNELRDFPTVLSGAFKMPNGTVYVALTNWSDETQNIEEIDFSKCNWLPDKFKLEMLTDKSVSRIGVFTTKRVPINIALRPRSAIFLIIKGLEEWKEKLNDFYNINEIKSMTLSDLKWRKIDEKEVNGVKVIVGEWRAGRFTTFDSKGKLRTITLHEKSVLYYPKDAINGKGFVIAKHIEGLIYDSKYVLMASKLKVPILTHGEQRVDWEELGFKSRDEMTHKIYDNLMRINKDEVKDITIGNFVLALARTNSMAITLLQRLCQRFGNEITEIALMGGSKEGYAVWFASSIDDRITIASPGGYQLIDFIYGVELMEKDWGCTNENLAPGFPQPKYLLKFRKWLIAEDTGRIVSSLLNIAYLRDKFKPKFYVIFGDIGAYGTHDGKFYPIGAETPFLKTFNRPWRYERIRNRAEAEYKRLVREVNIILALINGVEKIVSVWPKVENVQYYIKNNLFKVKATVSGDVERVYLIWCYSRDRVWNSKETPPWMKIDMRKRNGTWESEWIRRPNGTQIGFYVEAESRLIMKLDNYEIRYIDSSPVEFLFILPEKECREEPKRFHIHYITQN